MKRKYYDIKFGGWDRDRTPMSKSYAYKMKSEYTMEGEAPPKIIEIRKKGKRWIEVRKRDKMKDVI